MASGNINEVLVQMGLESFIALEAQTIISVPDVKQYPIKVVSNFS